MSRTLRYLLIILFVGLSGWALERTVLRADPVLVTVTTVERGRVEQTVTNSRAGTIKAARRARLSPEAGGLVIALPFREGDRVEEGEVVLRLSAQVPGAQVEVARWELATAKARAREACLAAELARREINRNQQLARDGIVSSEIVDRLENVAKTREAGCEAAERAVEGAVAGLGLASADLDRTVLRAPFDAVVADLAVEVGEWATPSPAAMPVPPVIDLLDPSSIYVSAPMDEVDSARLTVGQSVSITADPFPGRVFAGRLRRVAPFVLDVEQQNRTVEVEVDFLDPADRLRLLPGTSADIEVLLEARDGALRLPTPVVIEGRRVLLLEGDHLISRLVATGLRNWDFTEILGGVAEGDQVVDSLDRKDVMAGARARVESSPDS
jgi:HlyD family secretion protein